MSAEGPGDRTTPAPRQRWVEVDGSRGEGGGQILRSALALSLCTGQPCRLTRIRAGRARPGLRRQHLTAVQAAARIGGARVEGAALGSGELSFVPAGVIPGSYRFAVGTSGSTTLVLQTILPALAVAEAPSEVVLEGGTHNPFAPPFDFLDRVFLPLLGRMGPRVEATLQRHGFHPGGGGAIRVTVSPVARLRPLELLERGEIRDRRAIARVANLPRPIAERELATVRQELSWSADCLRTLEVTDARGPGNVLTLEIASRHVTELFTAFGRRGVPAERVAREVIDEVRQYEAADVPVGPHLADQLLVPLALAGGGRYATTRPTRHTHTNVEVVRKFLDVEVDVRREAAYRWHVAID